MEKLGTNHESASRGPVGVGRRARDAWLFFRTFLRHPSQLSSPVPSSPEITRTALHGLPLHEATCVLELGAGTGPLTAGIVSRLNGHGTRVIAVEYVEPFCRRLRESFPGVDVVQADAADLPQILTERGVDRIDHVISALPLFAWPAERRDAITFAIGERLSPQGTFTQVTGLPLSFFRHHFRRHFQQVTFRPVFRSFPPGGVFRCVGWKQ